MFAKYAVNHHKKGETETIKSQSKNKGKATLLLGLGVEQNFGSLFVRVDGNKVFKKDVATKS